MMQNIWLIFAICCVFACGNPSEKGGLEAAVTETINPDTIPKPPTDTLGIAYLTGRFDPAAHPDFVKIDAKFADRSGLFLRKDAYEAFVSMRSAAAKEGITLVIRSATRNFNYQKRIWEAKWNGNRQLSNGENAAKAYPKAADRARKIMEYSAMPGASRHHWGTDIDLNAFNNGYFEKGAGLVLFNWLTEHAHEYGFCRPYTTKGTDRTSGYEEEKWHWSFEPVAGKLTEEARFYLKDEMLVGFSGAEAAIEVGVVDRYVLGISKGCLE